MSRHGNCQQEELRMDRDIFMRHTVNLNILLEDKVTTAAVAKESWRGRELQIKAGGTMISAATTTTELYSNFDSSENKVWKELEMENVNIMKTCSDLLVWVDSPCMFCSLKQINQIYFLMGIKTVLLREELVYNEQRFWIISHHMNL